jgi:hypothetical protein
MRVTLTESTGTVLEFDPAADNVLAPTTRSERADAFAALCGALALVAGLEVKFTPWEPGSIHSAQPTDNIGTTACAVPVST